MEAQVKRKRFLLRFNKKGQSNQTHEMIIWKILLSITIQMGMGKLKKLATGLRLEDQEGQAPKAILPLKV